MKNGIWFFIVLLVSYLILVPQNVAATEISSGSSAKVRPHFAQAKEDNREKVLKAFLQKNNSPLVENASDFLRYADKYNLDWRLVAAISGLESTFGQYIPYNSFNGWGWGVYGDNVIYFSSWEEGIKTVSEGLRQNYINKWGAKDIYQIGRLYAASPTWAERVDHIMNRMGEFALKDYKSTLSLSL